MNGGRHALQPTIDRLHSLFDHTFESPNVPCHSWFLELYLGSKSVTYLGEVLLYSTIPAFNEVI